MAFLIAGLIIFFVTHLFSAFRTRVEGKDIKTRMGEDAYMGIYSLISAIGLGLIIYGYWSTPAGAPVYIGPIWARDVNFYVMAIAFVLLASAYVPDTHIKTWIKHPMVASFTLWAFAHLAIGADLKALLVFGAFAVYGVVDFIAASTRSGPAVATGAAPSVRNDGLAILIGLGVFALFGTWLHQLLFGVSPW